QRDPWSYPGDRCYGDCPFGSGIGPPPGVQGTSLLDRVTSAGATNITLSQNGNGGQIVNFTCQAGSECENIGNEAVFNNGGTITGENERANFTKFTQQMGSDVQYIPLNSNTYYAATGEDPVVFVNGFNAQQTVAAYTDHLLQDRPDLRGHVKQFSYQDDRD